MDLAAYLQRIGYQGRCDVTHEVLAQIVLRHACSIPFENLDAYLGQRVSLDPAAVERKLVGGARGGWCFEQNLLLGSALRAIGFEVTDLAGRVLWNRPPGVATARTHRVLLVRIDGNQWLADVGFGGQVLTGVLDLKTQDAQSTPHEPFRLRRARNEHAEEERVLEALIRGEWLPLYRFDLQPQLPIDFEAANYQLVHDPASHFTQQLVVSRVTPLGRHVLGGTELAFHATDGGTRREALRDPEALLAALRDVFGIEAPDAPRLAAKFEAQLAGSAARS